MNSSPRDALRRVVRALVPHAVLKRIADYRFGYSATGRSFAYEVDREGGTCTVAIDRRIRLRSTPAFLEDLHFHFVANGRSRDEIGAFIDISARLPEGSLLLDVGSHRGLFALVHCALGARHRAVLIDPSRSLAAGAAELLALNGFQDRTEILVAGAGARSESRPVAEDALGFARVGDDANAVATPFVTLDQVWRRLGADPAIVKIDVEGFEAEVLRGAASLLSVVRPLLFLELHRDELRHRGESPAALLRSLAALGYVFREPGRPSRSHASLARTPRAVVRLIGEPRQ